MNKLMTYEVTKTDGSVKYAVYENSSVKLVPALYRTINGLESRLIIASKPLLGMLENDILDVKVIPVKIAYMSSMLRNPVFRLNVTENPTLHNSINLKKHICYSYGNTLYLVETATYTLKYCVSLRDISLVGASAVIEAMNLTVVDGKSFDFEELRDIMQNKPSKIRLTTIGSIIKPANDYIRNLCKPEPKQLDLQFIEDEVDVDDVDVRFSRLERPEQRIFAKLVTLTSILYNEDIQKLEIADFCNNYVYNELCKLRLPMGWQHKKDYKELKSWYVDTMDSKKQPNVQ